MGLAASQARLLLLTARKSDLEYRAQQITNAQMILAMQTEEVARQYSLKISNQALFFIDSSKHDVPNTCLSAGDIYGLLTAGTYKLRIKDSNGNFHDWTATYDEYMMDPTTGDKVKIEEYDPSTHPNHTVPYKEPSTTGENYNPLELLEMINAGMAQIVTTTVLPDGTEEYNPIDINSSNGFTQSYYTDDDRQAEAEYQQKTAAIQVKEKRLNNDLKQIETQQKACDTEIDSVKKVMEKNIDRTFKIFS